MSENSSGLSPQELSDIREVLLEAQESNKSLIGKR